MKMDELRPRSRLVPLRELLRSHVFCTSSRTKDTVARPPTQVERSPARCVGQALGLPPPPKNQSAPIPTTTISTPTMPNLRISIIAGEISAESFALPYATAALAAAIR